MEVIEYLAAHYNTNQEYRKCWDFVDKLNFLRPKYICAECTWTDSVVKETIRALDYKDASLNSVMQLVADSKEKWCSSSQHR